VVTAKAINHKNRKVSSPKLGISTDIYLTRSCGRNNGGYKMDDKPDITDFVGKLYTTELGRQMPYGAVVSSVGVIIRVMTKEDYPELEYGWR